MKHFGVVALALVLASAGPAAAQQEKKRIQCWTDKNGQRMCGDRIPPEYAGQQREIFQDGRVVDTYKGARTAEEVAEEARRKREAEEAEKRAQYDRALLQTYRSAKDLEAMRDERLALIDSRIRSAEKNAADTDRSLQDLRARAEALKKDNKPVNEALAKQIRDFTRAQKQNRRALERYRAERESVQKRFDTDIARYNELRGTPATPAAPAPGGPPKGGG